MGVITIGEQPSAKIHEAGESTGNGAEFWHERTAWLEDFPVFKGIEV